MSQPNPQQSFPVTQQKAWSNLMKTMGLVNLRRAKDARKAAQELTRMRARS